MYEDFLDPDKKLGMRDTRLIIQSMMEGWQVDPRVKEMAVYRMAQTLADETASRRDHARAVTILKNIEAHKLDVAKTLAVMEHTDTLEDDELPTAKQLYHHMLESVPDPRIRVVNGEADHNGNGNGKS